MRFLELSKCSSIFGTRFIVSNKGMLSFVVVFLALSPLDETLDTYNDFQLFGSWRIIEIIIILFSTSTRCNRFSLRLAKPPLLNTSFSRLYFQNEDYQVNWFFFVPNGIPWHPPGGCFNLIVTSV